MGAPSYASIPDNDEPVQSSSGSPHHRGRLMIGGLLGLALVLSCIVALMIPHGGGTTPETGGPIELEAKAMVRACSFEECYASNCDHEAAPYTCLFNNGGPHGGCSVTPWIEGTCEDQCDLDNCDALEIPKTVKSCKGVKCGEAWCKGGQVCPKNVPYQCTSGSARFGCSMDHFQWTLRVDEATCSACCDASTC